MGRKTTAFATLLVVMLLIGVAAGPVVEHDRGENFPGDRDESLYHETV